jgi:hypothetical protein
MSILLSTWNDSPPTGRNLMKCYIFAFFFRKSVPKIQVSLKYHKNSGCFTGRCFMTSRSLLLRMRNVLAIAVEKIKTHILCSITYFRKFCLLWGNVEKYGGDIEANNNTLWYMLLACWITNATNTYSEYVILNGFFKKKMPTRTRLSVTFMRTLPVLLLSFPATRGFPSLSRNSDLLTWFRLHFSSGQVVHHPAGSHKRNSIWSVGL